MLLLRAISWRRLTIRRDLSVAAPSYLSLSAPGEGGEIMGSGFTESAPVRIIVKAPLVRFPAASRAVMVMSLRPGCRAMLLVQVLVPTATPLPPRLLLQLTCATPTLSEAQPLTSTTSAVAT